MKLTDEQITALRDGTQGVTPGFPRWIWLFGDRTVYTRDPSDGCRTAAVVRADFIGQNSEALAHIARCDPGTIHALATEVLETRALLASLDEERLEEIITDSIDLDWTPRDAARAIVRAMKGGE